MGSVVGAVIGDAAAAVLLKSDEPGLGGNNIVNIAGEWEATIERECAAVILEMISFQQELQYLVDLVARKL